jgi:hypothetical protein
VQFYARRPADQCRRVAALDARNFGEPATRYDSAGRRAAWDHQHRSDNGGYAHAEHVGMRREHDDESGDIRHDGTGQCHGRRGNAGRIAAGLLMETTQPCMSHPIDGVVAMISPLTKSAALWLGSGGRWTSLLSGGQTEQAASQFYSLLDFGRQERIEPRHTAVFLRENQTGRDDADHCIVKPPRVTGARHAGFLRCADRGGGNLVVWTYVGFDQPVEALAVRLSLKGQQPMQFRALGSEQGEGLQHLAQGVGRPLNPYLFSPIRKSSLPPTVLEYRSDDLAPQSVLGLEMVNDELVLYARVLGDLAQAGTLKAGRSEHLERRGKNAGASIQNIRRLESIHFRNP